MFIISGLQEFGLHRNMQNKVELFVRGPGQKMGCNKLLKKLANGLQIIKKIANWLYVVCHRFRG